MPAKHVHFESSLLNHAKLLVSEMTERLGLPNYEIGHWIYDHNRLNCHRVFSCRFISGASPHLLPIAILSNDDILRFIVPNDQGVLEVIDLKNKSNEHTDKDQPDQTWKPPVQANTPY